MRAIAIVMSNIHLCNDDRLMISDDRHIGEIEQFLSRKIYRIHGSSLNDVDALNHSMSAMRFSDLYIKAVVCPSYLVNDAYNAGKLPRKKEMHNCIVNIYCHIMRREIRDYIAS